MSGGSNGKVLTVSWKLAKILTDSRKSHHPIETLIQKHQFCRNPRWAENKTWNPNIAPSNCKTHQNLLIKFDPKNRTCYTDKRI